MAQIKLIGNWVKAKVARTWKEGSIVLIWRSNRPIDYYGALEIFTYFRPDWVENEFGYGYDSKIRYLLLNKNVPANKET